MNWVLLLGGLIPLWTALMIIYMNRSTRSPGPVKQVEAPQEDDDYDYEPAQEKPSRRGPLDALRGLSLGRIRSLRARLPAKKRQAEEAPAEDNPSNEESQEQPEPLPGPTATGLDLSGERRLWGATFIALAGASAMNGLYMVLDYVFREYRTVIGMKLPMAGTLQAASSMSLVVLGACVVVSAAKTGLKLLRG